MLINLSHTFVTVVEIGSLRFSDMRNDYNIPIIVIVSIITITGTQSTFKTVDVSIYKLKNFVEY